jgi:hypothetical protein
MITLEKREWFGYLLTTVCDIEGVERENTSKNEGFENDELSG